MLPAGASQKIDWNFAHGDITLKLAESPEHSDSEEYEEARRRQAG